MKPQPHTMTQSKLPPFDAEKMLEMSIGKKESPHEATIKSLRAALQGLLNALPSATTHPAIIAARQALEDIK